MSGEAIVIALIVGFVLMFCVGLFAIALIVARLVTREWRARRRRRARGGLVDFGSRPAGGGPYDPS